MVFTFPIVFGDDEPRLVVQDIDGNELDDTLDENTYATFGTIPKSSSAPLTLYVKNTGATPIYSVKCEGIASSHQLGEAANTYEALDLPQEMGAISALETIPITVTWAVPSSAPTGMKIFGIRVIDSTYLDIEESHEYWKKITITNNDLNPMIDFQVKIDFDNTFDWANTTYNGRDLRFYDTDFKALPHFVRYWSPGLENGQVYVKVPKIESGESIDIYLGYGKFDLVSTSTPAALLFYENFVNGFYNEWVNTGTLTYEFTALGIKLLTATATGTGLVVAFPDSANIAFDVAMTRSANNASHQGGIWFIVIPTADITSGGTGAALYERIARDYGTGAANGGQIGTAGSVPAGTTYGRVEIFQNGTIKSYHDSTDTTTPTLQATSTTPTKPLYLMLTLVTGNVPVYIQYLYAYKIPTIAPTILFTDVADITAEITNPDVDSGIICIIGNVVRQLTFHDYDFKKIIYEVGYNNALWRPPGSSGIYVWGKLEMRPLYGEDVSFVDNLYANDAYFYTFTDYTYDVHDKLDVEGVLYDIQAIQVHDAGRETIYKTLILKRQPEYYACCVGIVS